MPEHNEDQLLTDIAAAEGLSDVLVKPMPGRSRYPESIIDVSVLCPSCGETGDGSVIFGTRPVTDYIEHTHPRSTFTRLQDGLEGECDRCGERITVRLKVG